MGAGVAVNPVYISLAATVGLALGGYLGKAIRWGGNKETVLSTLEQGLSRVEALVVEVRDELRDDFQQLREKVDDMALTIAAHTEFIATLKEERRGR